MDAQNPLQAVRAEFIEKIGLVAQGDGLPRIAGRIMGLMVFDGQAYSFSQLADELQVSRGSISTNARLLERVGILERVAKAGDRQDYFKLAENPYEAVLRGAIERSRKASASIQKSIDQLPGGSKEIKRRLIDYRGFYDVVADSVSKSASDLSALNSPN